MSEDRTDLFKKEIKVVPPLRGEPTDSSGNRMFYVGTLIDGLIDYEGISGEILTDYEDYAAETYDEALDDYDKENLHKFILHKEAINDLFFPAYYYKDEKGDYQLLKEPYKYTKASEYFVEDNTPLVYPKLNNGEYAPIQVIHPLLNFPIIIGSINLTTYEITRYFIEDYKELFDQVEENADYFYYLDETNSPIRLIRINELGQTLVIDNDLTELIYIDSESGRRLLIGCVRDGGLLLGYDLVDEPVVL